MSTDTTQTRERRLLDLDLTDAVNLHLKDLRMIIGMSRDYLDQIDEEGDAPGTRSYPALRDRCEQLHLLFDLLDGKADELARVYSVWELARKERVPPLLSIPPVRDADALQCSHP